MNSLMRKPPKTRLHGSMTWPARFIVWKRFPERGAVIPESKRLRHLLFGKKPSTYRIIYALDKRKHVVSVLHIRDVARAPLSAKEKKAAVGLLAFSACLAHEILSFHGRGHLSFRCLDNENLAWIVPLFAD